MQLWKPARRNTGHRNLGIGRKNGKQFQDYKFYSCYDLTFANKYHLGKQFSVMIARTIPELKGQSCTTFNDPVTPAKSILSSRSFATVLTKKSIIKHVVIFHVSRAHKHLNRQQLYTCVHSPRYEKVSGPSYKNRLYYALSLEYASDDLLTLNGISLKQIDVLFK